MNTAELVTLVGFLVTIGTVIVGGVVLGNRQGSFEANILARLAAAEKALDVKASKESFELLCGRFDELKSDIGGRFDRIERLIVSRRGDTNPGA